jgi:hypothetical protein
MHMTKEKYLIGSDVLAYLYQRQQALADALALAVEDRWARADLETVAVQYREVGKLIDEIEKKPATEVTDADLDK